MAVIDLVTSRMEYLQREICSLTSHLNAATCRWLQLIAEYDEAEYYRQWDMPTMAKWLGWHCGIDESTARDHVRVARAIQKLPLTIEHFSAGEVSYSQVRAITRIATPSSEHSLLEMAKYMTASELARLVAGYRKIEQSCPDDERDDVNDRHSKRCFTWFFDEDGALVVYGRLEPEDAVLFMNAMEACKSDVPSAELEVDDRVDQWKRNAADSLVEMCRRALGSSSVGAAEVVINIDVDQLPSASADACEVSDISQGPVSRVSNGPRLYPETVRRLLCDGPLRVAISKGMEPLNIGRKSRTVPWPMRIALHKRDGGCQFPGCSTAQFTDAHHIQHWADGGETSLENLIELCRYHHRLLHEGGFEIVPTVDGREFVRPDYSRISRVAPALPGSTRPIELVNESAGASIDPYASSSQWENVPIDYGALISALLDHEGRNP